MEAKHPAFRSLESDLRILVETDSLTGLLRFRIRREKPSSEQAISEDPIEFKTDFGIQPISKALVKTTEFCEFLTLSVRYGSREVTAVGTGTYDRQMQTVKVNGIYPVLDASGSAAHVTISARNHVNLCQALRHWNEEDELAIFHSHPHFSSFKSQTDDQRVIRMACLLFGGVAVMVIVDPFSRGGVDISAYAIDPETKIVNKIPLELVP